MKTSERVGRVEQRDSLQVLALVPHPAEGASTRLRVLQYQDYLEEQGIRLEIRPFFSSEAFKRLYRGGVARRVLDTVAGFRGRSLDLLRAGNFHAVLIHRELTPFLSGPFLKRLSRSGVPLLFDLDDAVFLRPHGGSPIANAFRRPSRDVAALARNAAFSLSGNPYLGDFIERAGGRPINLPTTVDLSLFHPSEEDDAGNEGGGTQVPVRIAWIGSHSTQGYLDLVSGPLEAVCRQSGAEVILVSNRPSSTLGTLAVKGVEWRLEDETRYYRDADIGIYPLPDDPWTRGKCGLKALQFLASGVPVVASPVGVLREIVIEGRTGHLARGADEWVRALNTLVADRETRRRMGLAGRELVRRSFSVEIGGAILADSIRRAVLEHPTRGIEPTESL